MEIPISFQYQAHVRATIEIQKLLKACPQAQTSPCGTMRCRNYQLSSAFK